MVKTKSDAIRTKVLTKVALVEGLLGCRGEGLEALKPCHRLGLGRTIMRANNALVWPVAQSIRKSIEWRPRCWCGSDRQSLCRVLGGGKSVENFGGRHDEKVVFKNEKEIS